MSLTRCRRSHKHETARQSLAALLLAGLLGHGLAGGVVLKRCGGADRLKVGNADLFREFKGITYGQEIPQ